MAELTEKPKKSHGGARFNAGAKKTKPATVAIRVDARLAELIETLKLSVKLGTVEKIELDKLAGEFKKRNFDHIGADLTGKTSADYKERLNNSVKNHGAKLKGGMTLFNLLQKCIKDSATLIRNGVMTEREIINKFLSAHDLEGIEEIELFDKLRGNPRV